MIDGTIPPEMYDKYLNIVLNETERLTKLTNSLLTLNNLNTKGMLLNKTHFDINQTIRDTVATQEGSCRKKNLTIELLLTGDTLYVQADMDKIQQVLYNLIDNAIKFTPDRGKITITTMNTQGEISVTVEDDGIGMSEETMNHVFEQFYRGDNENRYEGSGLGLSLVQRIVHLHGGSVLVESVEGSGSIFMVTLPLEQ
jgi:signal transduction histidine kinase